MSGIIRRTITKFQLVRHYQFAALTAHPRQPFNSFDSALLWLAGICSEDILRVSEHRITLSANCIIDVCNNFGNYLIHNSLILIPSASPLDRLSHLVDLTGYNIVFVSGADESATLPGSVRSPTFLIDLTAGIGRVALYGPINFDPRHVVRNAPMPTTRILCRGIIPQLFPDQASS